MIRLWVGERMRQRSCTRRRFSVAKRANANCQLTAIYETASQNWQETGAVAPASVNGA